MMSISRQLLLGLAGGALIAASAQADACNEKPTRSASTTPALSALVNEFACAR